MQKRKVRDPPGPKNIKLSSQILSTLLDGEIKSLDEMNRDEYDFKHKMMETLEKYGMLKISYQITEEGKEFFKMFEGYCSRNCYKGRPCSSIECAEGKCKKCKEEKRSCSQNSK